MSLSEKLDSSKNKLNDIKIMVLGDAVIDRFTVVEPEGISREAPIPAMNIKKEYFRIGASFNAAKTLLNLSVKPIYITAVGSDPEGDHFIEETKKELPDAVIVVDKKKKTDSVYRVHSNGYLLLWAEKSSKKGLSKEAESSIIDSFMKMIDEAKVIIVSDHARGFLNKNIRDAATLNAKKKKIPVLINGRPENVHLYSGADYLRMNREDAIKLTGISPLNSTSYRNMALKLSSATGVENVLITWLEEGFFGLRSESFFKVDPLSLKFSNLGGIGDAIVAFLAVFLSLGFSFEESSKLSYYAASLRAMGEKEKGSFFEKLVDFVSKNDVK